MIENKKFSLLAIYFVSCLILLSLNGVNAEAPYSGGETSRIIPKLQASDRGAFSFPLTNLSFLRKQNFFVGNSFFQNAWVIAPSSTQARDGLGPLFNTNACQSCHIRDGRGRPPVENKEMQSSLVRVSIPSDSNDVDKVLGVKPHPIYGTQFQNQAVIGINREVSVKIKWHNTNHRYPDNTLFRLQRPELVLSNYNYGEVEESILTSIRVPPPMIGLGLLDTILEKDILANADPNDADNDGISGRANYVWDVKRNSQSLGRFGWKAGQPNIRQQVASAFSEDIGITSSLYPNNICTNKQTSCLEQPNGGQPEVSDEILDLVTFYSKTLAVPSRRNHDHEFIQKGEALFRAAKCNACHIESFVTGDDEEFPELSNQEIHPYTDLLLHDMGPDLADNRPVFNATGREWRTPPLWGIGLTRVVNEHTSFLHDGRARSIEEAILWHGGEAEFSRDYFLNLEKQQRRQLLSFLKSL